jgi:DNA (cytosine-5)-methyltransferase 1
MFDHGLERTGGFETVAFCEIEAFPRRVLAKHWPKVPCYDDVRTLTAERLAADGIAVDVICGGFPCQDISIAGNGSGLKGKRSGLWSEFGRLIGELRPRFVLVENSPRLRSRGLEDILRFLDSVRYDAAWDCVPAAYAGAPHRRDRIWLLAYRQEDAFCPDAYRLGLHRAQMHVHGSTELRDEQIGDFGSLAWWRSEPELERVVDGNPSAMDVARIRAVGNSVVPFIPEMIGRAILEQTPPQ